MKKLTTKEWVEKARATHGDKYDYSESVYSGSKNKITIICPTHGKVKVIAANHINGNKSQCPKCSGNYVRTYEELIDDLNVVHSNFYDYSKIEYKKLSDKVTIICHKHGEFSQTIDSHLQGRGCKACADIRTREAIQLSTSDFVSKAVEVHGSKYNYDKVEYTSMNDYVEILCHTHGYFKQKANNHVNQKQGCPKCGKVILKGMFLSTTEEFITKAIKVHNGLYSYEDVVYSGNRNLVDITCPEHGNFLQTPHAHLSGYGCTSCAKYGFDKNRPGLLYILSIDKGSHFKVGITNYSVNRRYNKTDLSKVSILHEKWYSKGLDAFTEEQKILNTFKEYKYLGEPILSSGNTEILTKGVPWDTYFARHQ